MSGIEAGGTKALGNGRRDGVATATTALGVLMGIGLAAAGSAGWLADVTDGDGSDMFFWLLLLVGGGAIVLAGVATLRTRPWGSVAAFAVGGIAGSLALFWSVVAPVLAITLLVLGVVHARRATR